jgi:hypothetical protein
VPTGGRRNPAAERSAGDSVSVRDPLLDAGFCDPVDVTHLRSVSHLFPRAGPRRCGLYVLRFADGARYAGQSVDIARRFLDHKRTHPDIVDMQYRALTRADLDHEERQLIRLLESMGPTRNITWGTGRPHDSDLDVLFPRAVRDRWLADPGTYRPAGGRVDDPAQRARMSGRLARLDATDHLDGVVVAVRRYLRNCVPAYVDTEFTYWALSCMPSTGRGEGFGCLACVSINTMETLTLVVDRREPSLTGGFINLKRSTIDTAFPDDDERYRVLGDVGLADSDYAAGGPDQATLTCAGIGHLYDVLGVPAVQRAARELNLAAMSKGATLQWRAHCFQLADVVMGGTASSAEN